MQYFKVAHQEDPKEPREHTKKNIDFNRRTVLTPSVPFNLDVHICISYSAVICSHPKLFEVCVSEKGAL